MTRHRRAVAGATAVPLGLSAGLLGLVLAADQASAAYCETDWGSLPKSAETYSTRTVEDVRAAQHSCFDRIVVDVGSFGISEVGYDVRYVDTVQGADGRTIALRGGASLQITVRAPAYDDAGRATYVPTDRTEVVPVAGYRTFNQAAWGGSFEGRTTLGLGVRARLPMRAFLLPAFDGGRRLVVDVAHSW